MRRLLSCLAGAATALLAACPAHAAAPSETVAAQPLWRLPAAAPDLRFVGEALTRTWPVYIPAQSVASIKAIQVAFQAAIAVMPEASFLTVTINGQAVGRLPIAAPNGLKTATVAVPPGTLLAGWNAIGFEAVQRHRVDCSIASTYELWTQIDPSHTGFVATRPKLAGLSDLAAIATDDDGATRLHLLLPKEPSPADLGRAVRIVEWVALRGRFAHPVVDTAPSSTGLQIAVGTPAFLAAATGASGTNATAPRLLDKADGATVLAVPASTDDDVDRVIEALGPSADPVGTEEGLKALERQGGLRLHSGGSVSFADLGIGTRTFSGRVFREAFDVVLPPDAYPADYGEARLSLDGGYAAGLTRDARLVVRVNGIIDGNLDFTRSGGAVLQGQVIHMPLDPFRPGRNRIEIEAQLPTSGDESCDPLAAIGAKERFLLLGTTTLSLPPLARVAQFPSIAASLGGNFRVTPKAPPRFFIPRASDGTVAAVATLLANAAMGAGAPSGAVFVRGTPTASMDPAVVVGLSSDMPMPLLMAAGLDGQALSRAWRSGPRAPGTDGTGDTTRRNAPDTARLDAWGEHVDQGGSWLGGPGSLVGSMSDRFLQSMRGAGLLPYPERPLVVTGDTAFVFAQGLVGEMPLTLVTARDDASLATGSAMLTEPSRLSNLDGRAASLEDGSAGANLVPARETAFFRTQPFSFVNDRLIAAGWVSKHAAWYIGAVLLAAMMLGTATWSVLTFGRREQPT